MVPEVILHLADHHLSVDFKGVLVDAQLIYTFGKLLDASPDSVRVASCNYQPVIGKWRQCNSLLPECSIVVTCAPIRVKSKPVVRTQVFDEVLGKVLDIALVSVVGLHCFLVRPIRMCRQ